MYTTSIPIIGNSTGLFNITVMPQNLVPIDLSTYNSSLCAVIGVSPSNGTLQIYRPGVPLNPFTYLHPGQGYIIFASDSFTINAFTTPTQYPDEIEIEVIQKGLSAPLGTTTNNPKHFREVYKKNTFASGIEYIPSVSVTSDSYKLLPMLAKTVFPNWIVNPWVWTFTKNGSPLFYQGPNTVNHLLSTSDPLTAWESFQPFSYDRSTWGRSYYFDSTGLADQDYSWPNSYIQIKPVSAEWPTPNLYPSQCSTRYTRVSTTAPWGSDLAIYEIAQFGYNNSPPIDSSTYNFVAGYTGLNNSTVDLPLILLQNKTTNAYKWVLGGIVNGGIAESQDLIDPVCPSTTDNGGDCIFSHENSYLISIKTENTLTFPLTTF